MIFKKNKNEEAVSDGSRAISKLHVSDFVIVFVIFLLCMTCILPFWHMLVKSLSGNLPVVNNEVVFWPKEFTFSAYSKIINEGSMVRSMFYSAGVTLIFTALGMLACTCAAYPLSKKRLMGRTAISFLLMIPMYFAAGTIPTYLLYNRLNLIDSMWVLILPLIFSPYNMLVMKSYFQSTIPDSLEESAFLDGASNFKIIWYIVLPLSKPIIATLSLFYAVGRWNAYSDCIYYITKQDLHLVQYKLYNLVSGAQASINAQLGDTGGISNMTTPEVLQAASVMFVTIPIIIVYPFLQKYFVKGAMIGAVKG